MSVKIGGEGCVGLGGWLGCGLFVVSWVEGLASRKCCNHHRSCHNKSHLQFSRNPSAREWYGGARQLSRG